MMKTPLISVVVPVYNIADYLERSVESVREQTYRHLEIILVDNGSTDGSTELVDDLAKIDERIIPLHVEKKGVSFARLEGVKASSGEWIGFVDGDDVIEPDMYERLLNNAFNYNAQISHCGYQMVFPSRVDYYYNTGRLVQQDNLTGLKDLLGGSFVEPGLWNKLFHKTLFHSLLHPDGFDLSIRINEDLLMNYYLFKESVNSVFEDFCPYHYIVRPGSAATSAITVNRILDPVKVAQLIVNDTKDGECLSLANRRLIWVCYIGASLKKTESEAINSAIDYCRTELKKLMPLAFKEKYSISFKTKCILCRVSPFIYRFFDKIISRIRGTGKKYEVS